MDFLPLSAIIPIFKIIAKVFKRSTPLVFLKDFTFSANNKSDNLYHLGEIVVQNPFDHKMTLQNVGIHVKAKEKKFDWSSNEFVTREEESLKSSKLVKLKARETKRFYVDLFALSQHTKFEENIHCDFKINPYVTLDGLELRSWSWWKSKSKLNRNAYDLSTGEAKIEIHTAIFAFLMSEEGITGDKNGIDLEWIAYFCNELASALKAGLFNSIEPIHLHEALVDTNKGLTWTKRRDLKLSYANVKKGKDSFPLLLIEEALMRLSAFLYKNQLNISWEGFTKKLITPIQCEDYPKEYKTPEVSAF